MKKIRVIGIIPARYNSKRFPGKLLIDLNGKPVIQHVYERAKQSKSLDFLAVATDSDEIAGVVIQFGGDVCITDKHETGTERVAETLQTTKADIIVNIQGDEPLLHPSMIDSLVKIMKKDKSINVATVITSIKSFEDINNPNVVKVVIGQKNNALYFTRRGFGTHKHIGIYAYRKDFLQLLIKLPKSINEKQNSLEQMRIIDNGYKIKVIETKYDTIAIDVPEDLERAKNALNKN